MSSARILGDLHDANGAVALPGFYDGVEELPEEIREQWSELDFDAGAFLGEVGLTTPAGERDRTPLEQLWSRPTCDVNGIVGGYTGEGTKTVLPAEARAKISFRLVGKQSPERVVQSFRSFVASRLPPDVKAEFVSHAGSPAISLPISNEALRRARRALEAEWGKPAALDRLRRLDPDRRRVQARTRHGQPARRLRAGGRQHPFAQREIRADVVPQGRALLGADPLGARRMSVSVRVGDRREGRDDRSNAAPGSATGFSPPSQKRPC